jgi:hypothetical protein
MNPGLDAELSEEEVTRQLDRKEFERHVYAEILEDLQLDSAREMGYVYKCLGSAILTLRTAIRATSQNSLLPTTLFENLMTDLIMEGGDSDTNGAAAGALLGAWLGYSNIAPHWALGLAHKGWLDSKIDRLMKAVGILDGPLTVEEDEAPDGGKGLLSRDELEKRDYDMVHMVLLKNKERQEKEERKRAQLQNQNQNKGLAGWFRK